MGKDQDLNLPELPRDSQRGRKARSNLAYIGFHLKLLQGYCGGMWVPFQDARALDGFRSLIFAGSVSRGVNPTSRTKLLGTSLNSYAV